MPEANVATDLIERAFGLARESGKTEWWAMTIPVLKNRLLLLTKNAFKESDFGATSFRDFLSKASDIVRIDEAPLPGFVILKSAAPERWEQSSTNKFRGERVRADLWRAVLDYSSSRRYVWDTSQQVARPASSDEDGLILPTISAVDFDAWRAEFVASYKPPDAGVAKLVEEWSKKRLPTGGLPASLRPLWNNFLKHKVERRIQRWFETNSIKAPEIIEAGQVPRDSEREVEELRQFIASCVSIMSIKELQDLRISPSTAMRILRGKNSSDENER